MHNFAGFEIAIHQNIIGGHITNPGALVEDSPCFGHRVARRIGADQSVTDVEVVGEAEHERLAVEGSAEGGVVEAGAGLEGEGEGVGVGGHCGAAHAGKEEESGERSGEKGVDTHEEVVWEGGWERDGVEEGEGVFGSGVCSGREGGIVVDGGGEEEGEPVEELGEDGGAIERGKAVYGSLGMDGLEVAEALAAAVEEMEELTVGELPQWHRLSSEKDSGHFIFLLTLFMLHQI